MTTVRRMQESDLSCVKLLCAQLGYDASLNEIKMRFLTIAQHDDHALLVAEESNKEISGFIHVRQDESLHSGTTIEISALVVLDSQRGKGLGKILIAAAETWARERNVLDIWLLSNVTRESAHKFYQSLGYANSKSAFRFVRQL